MGYYRSGELRAAGPQTRVSTNKPAAATWPPILEPSGEVVDTVALLESWSREIESRCGRVRTLIGGRHWPSDGRHKELLLADQLVRYVDPRLCVGSGFIVGPGAENISPEIDVLLADFSRSPPLLNEGGIRIVPAECVLAVLEIKSTLSGAVLLEVFEHLRDVLRTLGAVEADVWIGAFFYSKDGVYADLADRIARACGPLIKEGLLGASRKLCITIMNDSVSFLDNSNAHPNAKVKLLQAKELSFSLALADLLGFATPATGMHQLDALIEQMPPIKAEIAEVPST